MKSGVKFVAVAALAMLGAGCAILPKDGPSAAKITNINADQYYARYLVVDVTPSVVQALSAFRPKPFAEQFGTSKPAPTQRLGAGDVLQITLFESGQGGLFSSDTGSRVSFTANVDSSGRVTVPYGGRVRAAGRTPGEFEQAIVQALEGKAIQPQALVTLTTPVSNSIVVNGEVGSPGRFPISPAGDRLLDAIATAGGARTSAFETEVRLERRGQTGRVLMKRLVDNPRENVYVLPGDKIFVSRSPLVFTVFGSAGTPGAINFETEELSLIEALGKVRGLNDFRADPTGVFLFRYEPDYIARAVKPDYKGHFGESAPVVYRINMNDPQSYLIANGFMVREKDVLYVASAPGSQLLKFFQILNGVGGAANSATALSGQ